MKHLFYIAGLIEAAGLGEAGVDLYVGTTPADVVKGLMLVDPLTGHELDEGMRGFVSGEFQMIVRDPDPEDGWARALAISRAISLNNVGDQTVAITWIRPVTLPITYPRGDADTVETSVRFRIGFKLL